MVLQGTVDKRATMELAETVAKSVSGVKLVRNEIKLEANVENPNKAGKNVDDASKELKK